MERGEAKRQLRQEMTAVRRALTEAERERRSRVAARFLLGLEPLSLCRTIMLFYPFRDEIDTRPFIAGAQRRGQTVLLPLTLPAEKQLIPYVYEDEASLRQGAYGISEPNPDVARKAAAEEVDAVILPGLAFDRQGGRLGYGGGYYDRFLSQLPHRPLLIGFAFDCQVTGQVPVEAHDIRTDYLVTDGGVYGPFVSE